MTTKRKAATVLVALGAASVLGFAALAGGVLLVDAVTGYESSSVGDAPRVEEDDPGFDCENDGNGVCGRDLEEALQSIEGALNSGELSPEEVAEDDVSPCVVVAESVDGGETIFHCTPR